MLAGGDIIRDEVMRAQMHAVLDRSRALHNGSKASLAALGFDYVSSWATCQDVLGTFCWFSGYLRVAYATSNAGADAVRSWARQPGCSHPEYE